jgi:hypothetical protein
MSRIKPFSHFRNIEISVEPSSVPSGLRKQSQFHESRRVDAVSELLYHFYMMGAKKQIKADPPPLLAIAPAALQSFHSTGGNQAAHCVPGQILISGGTPTDWLLSSEHGEKTGRMALFAGLRINQLFGSVDDLPADFNKSDSRIERYGLREAFLEASRRAIKQGIKDSTKKRTDPEVVYDTYQLYQIMADSAYDIALRRLDYKISNKIDQAASEKHLEISEIYRDTMRKYEPEALKPGFPSLMESVYEDLIRYEAK